MTDLRQRLAEASLPWRRDENGLARDVRTSEQAADVAASVFADWLREHAEGARFVTENMPDDEDLTTVATWGGARAVLNALADAIAPRGEEW